MFSNPTDRQAEAMVELVKNLQGLGAGTEALARTRAVYGGFIEDATNIREDIRRTVLGQIEKEDPGPIKLAQADENRRRLRRDRDELGQTGAPGAAFDLIDLIT